MKYFLPYKPNVKNEKYAHMHSYCINHVSITTLEQFTIIRVSRKWRITAKVFNDSTKNKKINNNKTLMGFDAYKASIKVE